VMRW